MLSAVALVASADVRSSTASACEDSKLGVAQSTGLLFGFSTAIEDLFVVGAPRHDGQDFNTGGAFVYHLDGTAWVTDVVLMASDGVLDDHLGTSVAVDGDLVAVGAPGVNGPGPGFAQEFGAVYVFHRDGDTWSETKLMASDGVAQDILGRSVGLSGSFLVTGADGDDDNGLGAGAAYVFQFDGECWIEAAKLLASDGQPGDCFGSTVGLDGNVAVIGAFGDDANGDFAGAAYVFRHNVETDQWLQEAKLLASDGEPLDFLGAAVAVEGDWILVGAPQNYSGDPGAVYFYHYDGAHWLQTDKVVPSDGADGDLFGFKVAMSGSTAIVGAEGDDDNGNSSGAAYVLTFDRIKSRWLELAKLLPSDGDADDEFGHAVAVAGTTVVVGAPRDEDHGPLTGSVYTFELDGTDCNQNGICDQRDITEGGSGDVNGNSIPDECDADLNGDGAVGIVDFLQLLGAWGACGAGAGCPEDLDGNGVVSGADFLILITNWTA